MNKLAVGGVVLVVAAGLYVMSSSWKGLEQPVEKEPTPVPKPELPSIPRETKVATPERAAESEEKVEEAAPLEAEMTLSVVADSPARIHVEGKTNLPEGTVLQVTAIPDIQLGPATVQQDNTFATLSASVRQAGDFKIILRSEASDQPARVNEVIGRKGEHLTGPFAAATGFVARGTFQISGKPFRQLPVTFDRAEEKDGVDAKASAEE